MYKLLVQDYARRGPEARTAVRLWPQSPAIQGIDNLVDPFPRFGPQSSSSYHNDGKMCTMAHREKHVQLGINVTPEMRETMQELSTRTRIPQSVLFRQALEDLFAKYVEILRAPNAPKAKR